MQQPTQGSAEDFCAKVRGLTTVLVGAANNKDPMDAYASRYLSKDATNPLLDNAECNTLRSVALILPRRNEEVVALGLIRRTKDEPYRVYARNSQHAQPKSQPNPKAKAQSKAPEAVSPISQDVLGKAERTLRTCKGIEAADHVFDLLSQCVKVNKQKKLIMLQKIPFANHVKIVCAMLQNFTDQIPAMENQLEAAFYLYVHLSSYQNHERRLVQNPVFIEFFKGKPLELQSHTVYVRCRTHRRATLQKYLQQQQKKFIEPLHQGLESPVKDLCQAIDKALKESTDIDDTLVLNSEVLIQGTHKMLGHYLTSYATALTESVPRCIGLRTFMALSEVYDDLNEFMERMYYFVRTYLRLIDTQPSMTSFLGSTPATKDEDFLKSMAGHPLEYAEMTLNDDIEVEDQPQTIGVGDSNSIGDLDVNEQHPMEGYKPFQKAPNEYAPVNTNTWGTCAFTWIEQIIAQAHETKSLWGKRKLFLFDAEVLEPPKPGIYIPDWTTQSCLKDHLDQESPRTFELLSDLFQNSSQFVFDGSIHAELIVAAELLLQHNPTGPLFIGISRPPCYVCYHALQYINAKMRPIYCRPARSSEKVWKVDLPTKLPLHVLINVWEKLSSDAAQTFKEHHPTIERLANEAKTHSGRMRSLSVNSEHSVDMDEARWQSRGTLDAREEIMNGEATAASTN